MDTLVQKLFDRSFSRDPIDQALQRRPVGKAMLNISLEYKVGPLPVIYKLMTS